MFLGKQGKSMINRSLIFFIMLGGVAINSLAAETLNAFQTDGLYGRLNMNGSIIKNACSISLDSVDQTVDFGKIPVSRFMQAGPEILSVPFKIRVNNCDQKEGSRLAVNALNRVSFAGGYTVLAKFYGDTVAGHPDLLGGKMAIPGVGLRIRMDKSSTVINFNQQTDPLPLFRGNGELLFYATLVRYGNVQDIRTGDFEWNTTFSIYYQ